MSAFFKWLAAAVVCLEAFLCSRGQAQTFPTVTIEKIQDAAEPTPGGTNSMSAGTHGFFRIRRTNYNPKYPLTVYFGINGNGQLGYATIQASRAYGQGTNSVQGDYMLNCAYDESLNLGRVTIMPNWDVAYIEVTPLADGLREGVERIELEIVLTAWGEYFYNIGSPGLATMDLADGG